MCVSAETFAHPSRTNIAPPLLEPQRVCKCAAAIARGYQKVTTCERETRHPYCLSSRSPSHRRSSMNDLAHGVVCAPARCDIETSPSPAWDAKKGTSLMVEIVSDVICPWCFVAKRNFQRAAAKLPGSVKMPVAGNDRRAYRSAKFGSWARSLE